MDEAALIRAACQGDLDSFNCLVVTYQDMVYSQAYRMMGDNDAAADATQEAFIAAYRNLRSYRGGSFRAWLMRIVTNACYDEMRRRKRRPTTPLEPLDDTGEEMENPQWMTDPGETPEESAERIELGQAIQHCLDNLPEDFRSVVILVDMQGMDYSEAAQTVHKPVGTVKSRLARGRLRLQDCLKGFGELLPSTFRQGDES
ncbi:MAG: RNA polymerase sigma factor [Omnitrophica WOR_2 bacterium]